MHHSITLVGLFGWLYFVVLVRIISNSSVMEVPPCWHSLEEVALFCALGSWNVAKLNWVYLRCELSEL